MMAWATGYLRIGLFLGIYGVRHQGYFLIPDPMLRDQIHYHALTSAGAECLDFLAPSEGIAAVGNHIRSVRADLEIVRGCDGAGAVFLLIAAIFAFPAPLRTKLIGMGMGVGLLYAVNLARIVALYFVIAYGREWFHLLHTYLAPTLVIAAGCLFFAWWAFKLTPNRDATG